jgi:hypothetical protein
MLYNIPLFFKREYEHILRKQCQYLYKPARAEQISAAIFLFFPLWIQNIPFSSHKIKNNNYKTIKKS